MWQRAPLKTCPAKILVRKDGAVVVDGRAYSDMDQLKARFRGVHPGCEVSFVVDKGDYKAVVRALSVFQELGAVKIGFSNGTR